MRSLTNAKNGSSTARGASGQQNVEFGDGLSCFEEPELVEEKQIKIEVETIENILSIGEGIDSTKIKEIAVRIEFRGQSLLETESIAVPESGECVVGAVAEIPLESPLQFFLDDILAYPIVFTVIDRTMIPVKIEKDPTNGSKKESKKESRKASRASLSVKSAVRSAVISHSVIGICNMDIGPIVKGQKLLREAKIVEVDKVLTGPELVTWPKLPRLYAVASVGDSELLPPHISKLTNVIDITVESVYNAPGNIEEGTTFDASIMIPSFGDKMHTVTFSNGVLTTTKDCECLKRWLTLSNIEGRGSLSRHKVDPDVCDIINTNEDEVNMEKIIHEDGPRIHWNKWRSAIMVKTGTNYFFGKLSKYRLWPIEVAIGSRPASQKVVKPEKRAKTAAANAPSIPERYVAYIRLGTLLYPGVTKARVASQLFTYSPSDLSEKCGPDFVPPPPPAATSTAKVKISEKAKSTGKEVEQEVKDVPANPVYNENGQPVFIVVEVELWKPYIAKREPEYFFDRLSEYFPPKGKLSKKMMNMEMAQKSFGDTIEKLSFAINGVYTAYMHDCKIKGDVLKEAEDRFFDHLCKEGIIQQMKVSLEDRIVDLVGEKFGDVGDCKEKMPEVFIYLVEEMRKVTNTSTAYKKSVMVPDVGPDDLQLSAEEAIEDGNFRLARRYLLQKLSLNKLNPDFWLDFGHFSLIANDSEKCIECIREALLMDMGHQVGLLFYGLEIAKTDDIGLAELVLQVLVGKYPDFVEGWMVLHLFYLTVGNLEGAEFCFQTASRLDCEKKKETELDNQRLGIVAEDSTRSCNTGRSTEPREDVSVSGAEGKYGMASFSHGKSTTDPLSWTVNLGYPSSLYIRSAILLLRFQSFELADLALTRERSSDRKGCSIQYLYYLAVGHYLRGQYDEAISHLLVAVDEMGKNSFLWSLLGHCHYKLKNFEKCIECFEYVMVAFNRPDDIHLIYLRMGIYHLRTQKYNCAKKVFLKVCACSPSSETWLGLGAACYNLGEFEEAEAALTEANFLDYLCPVVWGYLTLVNIQLQRYDVFELCYAETKKKNLRDESLKNQIETLMEVHRLKGSCQSTSTLPKEGEA